MINILIADDHQMVIDGLKALLASEKDIAILGQALNGQEAIEFVKKRGTEVDIVVLDINMPELDGIEATKFIKLHQPNINILILSMYNKPIFIKGLIESGVSGYILKNTGKDELINAIQTIQRGETYFSAEVTKTVMDSFKNNSTATDIQLTKRELEILTLLANALTTAEIAEKLFLSPYTIDTHRKNLLSKLNLKNTPALIKFAIEKGLVNYEL